MRRFSFILILGFCALFGQAQNLIPNPSFEVTFQGSFGITKAQSWSSPTDGSPDLMNNKSISRYHVPQNFNGFQFAFNDSSYFGFAVFSFNRPNSREYIQSKLLKPLKKDSTYCFQIYLSLSDSSQYALKNNLGTHFSSTPPSSQDLKPLNVDPQILFQESTFYENKQEWTQLQGSYTANGQEEYITIGNFSPDSLIDTLFLGNGGISDDTYKSTYYYVDYLYLGHCDSVPLDTPNGLGENTLRNQISLYPNPCREQLFINYKGNRQLQIQLYNSVGQSVRTEQQQNGNQWQLSVGHLPKGIYLVEIIADRERISRKIIKQ